MLNLTDSYSVDATSLRKTEDGYLVAFSRMARTGIQVYKGSEVGRPDLDKVRVFRPEAEVFAPDSMHSYAHRPLTNDHPPVPVTANNWKKYSVGQTGEEVVRDGQFIRVPMVLMDAAVIKSVEDGKRELSLGYTCDVEWAEGKTSDGQDYDAVQKNIRANHLAVVGVARGGKDLRIGDAACPHCGYEVEDGSKYCPDCGHKMTKDSLDGPVGDKGDVIMKTIMVDGISVQLEDKDAQIVSKAISSLEQKLRDAEKETEEERKKREEEEKKNKTDSATLQTQVATKDTELAALKTQLADATMTPQKLDTLVSSRVATITKAKAILADKLVIDGKTDHEIRRQVVDAKVGDVAKGWNDEMVTASFNTITVDTKSPTNGFNGVNDISAAFNAPHVPMGDAREAAYNQYDQDLANAWKGKAA